MAISLQRVIQSTSCLAVVGVMRVHCSINNAVVGIQKSWVDKFYVLYKTSERNAARLDWYDSENAFQTQPSIRKTLFIEEILSIKRISPSDDEIRHKFGDVGRLAQ